MAALCWDDGEAVFNPTAHSFIILSCVSNVQTSRDYYVFFISVYHFKPTKNYLVILRLHGARIRVFVSSVIANAT